MRTWVDRGLIAAFLVGISAPLVDLWVRPADARSPLREMRSPSPPPELDGSLSAALAFPTATNDWWRDTFGLRDFLIHAHNCTKMLGFGSSPSTEITIGKRGWIFYSGFKVLEADVGLDPLSAEDLDAWARMLEARRAWLAARGVQYLAVWVPSKALVYPEHLPDGYATRGPNRLDQLVERLGPSWKHDLIDLREAQRAEKAFDRPEVGDWTWYPLGTHWCERGSFAGYVEIMKNLLERFPSIKPRDRSVFEQKLGGGVGDSWAGRLYMERELPQASWKYTLKPKLRALRLGRYPGHRESEHWRGGNPAGPRILMFHDSMGPWIRGYIAEQSVESFFFWQPEMDPNLVLATKPDLVISLYSDRQLGFPVPNFTGAESKDLVRAAYEKATRSILEVDTVANRPAILTRGKVELLPTEAGLGVWTKLGTDTLLLPAFQPVRRGRMILRVTIDSLQQDKMDVLYKTKSEPSYDRKRCYHVALEQGSNDVYIELAAPDILGDLMLRPGRTQGRFLLRNVEIRVADE